MVQILHSSGRSWELGFSPNYMALCWGWGLWRECVSAIPTCFDVGIFSVSVLVGVSQLVSGYLSKGLAPCIALHLVHLWEEGNSRTFYITILIRSPLDNFFQSLHAPLFLITSIFLSFPLLRKKIIFKFPLVPFIQPFNKYLISYYLIAVSKSHLWLQCP